MRYLNIGCGTNFHKAWVNIDIHSSSPYVEVHNIRNGLPFQPEEFHAVYCSHLLEHLKKNEAILLLKEVVRILMPRGVIRVVVPDLESIAQIYLEKLNAVYNGAIEAEPDYDWILLELFDQTVRNSGGGEMLHYLCNKNIKNKNFVLSRIGMEAEIFFNKKKDTLLENQSADIKARKSIKFAIKKTKFDILRLLVKFIGDKDILEAFDEGIFRNSGEVHRWMYDRYSLKRLLQCVGFQDIQVCKANESRIVDFNTFDLDIINGVVRKPDSLFMEGIKPDDISPS